jgi:hypothetical protein
VPLSIALVPPFVRDRETYEYRTPEGGEWEYEPLTVRPHKYAWRCPSEPNVATAAECITYNADRWQFSDLEGKTGAESMTILDQMQDPEMSNVEDMYEDMLPILREMAEQHPDAMWFVG